LKAKSLGYFARSISPDAVQGLGGVSALLPFTDIGENIIGPKTLSDLLGNPNVDGVSVRLYWRYFYQDQNKFRPEVVRHTLHSRAPLRHDRYV